MPSKFSAEFISFKALIVANKRIQKLEARRIIFPAVVNLFGKIAESTVYFDKEKNKNQR